LTTVPEIITAMRQVAPPGQRVVPEQAVAELKLLTKELVATRPEAIAELLRFQQIRQRSISLPDSGPADLIRGRRVLVTGGTGCIGSRLLAQLARLRPEHLASVSRGHAVFWPRHERVRYMYADISDRDSLRRVFAEVRPDTVFHLAAQRDPGLAEQAVEVTVGTNVLGTRNVVEACAEHGVDILSCASSGKALRPYSREVYTATKRLGEWLLAEAAPRTDMTISASRFTHVVDNSIVFNRLVSWAQSGVIRLHDSNTLFYAQSAKESAQLLVVGALSERGGRVRVNAVTDLGWPVNLLDLAIGALARAESDSPIYFSGHDPGYEHSPFPVLYDPASAGETSPLFSAFEAGGAECDSALGVDSFQVSLQLDRVPDDLITELERSCTAIDDSERVRAVLDELSWCLLDATLAAVPAATLSRVARLAAPYEDALSSDHSKMLALIQRYANSGQAP